MRMDNAIDLENIDAVLTRFVPIEASSEDSIPTMLFIDKINGGLEHRSF